MSEMPNGTVRNHGYPWRLIWAEFLDQLFAFQIKLRQPGLAQAMSDVFSKRKRSAVMALIRSRGNRDTELRLIALMRAHGITGWRRGAVIRSQRKEVGSQRSVGRGKRPEVGTQQTKPGKRRVGDAKTARFRVRPDFVFRARRLAVFVDGCFWHGCPKHFSKPRSNAAFWRNKIAANRARDRLVTRTLRAMGWRVMRIWEHELVRKNEPRLLARFRRVLPA